jgi:hypothetical protein
MAKTSPQEIFIIELVYDILFNHADWGSCYVGEGSRIVRVFQNREAAESLVAAWNPIINQAKQEIIVCCPCQPANAAIKKEFGFALGDVCDDAENFSLKVTNFDVEQ